MVCLALPALSGFSYLASPHSSLLATVLSVPQASPVPVFPGAFQQAVPSRNAFSHPSLSDQFHVTPQTDAFI